MAARDFEKRGLRTLGQGRNLEFLSHYTSRAGLEGIAGSKSLWATNFLMLNDTSELFFTLRRIHRSALDYVVERIPPEIIQGAVDLDDMAADVERIMREQLSLEAGHIQPYVCSFAMSKSLEQENNGILTLWDRYTNLEGYCLQFRKEDVLHYMQLEASTYNYFSIDLTPVQYSINGDDQELRQIIAQFGEHLLAYASQRTRDPRVGPSVKRRWSISALTREVVRFCGRHKHPSFEDEREQRIIAFPSDRAEPRFLTGVAMTKPIQQASNGKRYIALWEAWRPGLEPRRIIIGPHADPDLGGVLELFERRPEVIRSNIPIVRA